MKRYLSWFFPILLAILLPSVNTALAQQDPEERKRDLIDRIESLRPTEEGLGAYDRWYWYDWGGWITGTFTDYHNDQFDTTPAEAFSEDVRVWAKAGVNVPRELQNYLGKQHHIYFRMKNAYQQEHLGDNDNDGPHVDMLYLEDKFAWKKVGRLETRIGRRFLTMGRGIVYSNLHDGVDGTLTLSPASLKIFYSRTLPHEHNVDTSAPGFDKHYERHFFGLELEFLKLAQHRPYAFFLLTRDSSREDLRTETRDFHYDANYYGLGSKGELLLPNLRYYGELIWETGLSILSGTSQTEGIRAYGLGTGLEYYFDYYSHPVVKLEYARGSGDEDRRNVTNTTNGNRSGDDKNFLYFGHFTSGGYALNARLSNINVYKVGLTFKPLERVREGAVRNTFFEGVTDLTIGSNYYVFGKVESLGAVSDPRADRNFHKIGREWDIFVTWRITSDLNFGFKWGYLHALDAYPTKTEDERFLSTNLTFAF